MAYHYSDPFRESDPYTQPDIETFRHDDYPVVPQDGGPLAPGWYWWSCFPGCLPDGDPYGPFPTERLALKDARAKAGMFL